MIRCILIACRAAATLVVLAALGSNSLCGAAGDSKAIQRRLYVTEPGIRNELEYGGAGILVFDIDKDHAFMKRIETSASRETKPENVKGVCACAATQRLYFTTLERLYCFDLAAEKE